MRKLLVAAALLGTCASAAWCVPQLLNFQGSLSESGSLVTGTRSMTFRLFDASSAGNLVFSESQTVAVSAGVFNVLIGAATTGGVPLSAFDGNPRYIEVQVGSQTLPRQQIVSVGYSYRSESAATANYAQVAGALSATTPVSVSTLSATTVNVATLTATNISISSAVIQGNALVSGGVKIGHSIVLGTVSPTLGANNTIAFDNGPGVITAMNPGAGPLTIATVGADPIVLNPGGNVGIGTASPQTTLHVAGGPITSGQASAVTGGLRLYNAASANATTLQAGNATAAVVYKLPPADGLPGQVLSTDGNGNLIWVTALLAQQPTINSVSPQAGTVNGGTTITINGNGFQNGATVKLGGVSATGVQFVSVNTLVAVTPPSAAGAKDVLVTNPGGQQGLLAAGYSYVAVIGCASGTNDQIFASNMIGCNGNATWGQSAALCNQSGGWHQCSLAEYGARRGGLEPTQDRWLAQQPSDFSDSQNVNLCAPQSITTQAPVSITSQYGEVYAYQNPNCSGLTSSQLTSCYGYPQGGPNACTAAGGIYRAGGTSQTLSRGSVCCF